MKRAFTLIELLVVIAIIAILAAILFPVFAQAKAAAKKAAAISNFKQQNLAYPMYEGDKDDTVPIITYNNTYRVDNNLPDSTPQLEVYPYEVNQYVYNDPMDPASDTDRIYTEQVVNPDTVLAQYKQQQILFNYLYKSDIGLNWDAMMTLLITTTAALAPQSIIASQIANPAKFIFGIDSVWNRDGNGKPYGGGNVALDEPCFFDQDGTFNLFNVNTPGVIGYYYYGGWNPSQPLAWNVFGGVWPWHVNGSFCVVAFGDGHAKTMPIGGIAAGCNVVNGSLGHVNNPNTYMWSWKY